MPSKAADGAFAVFPISIAVGEMEMANQVNPTRPSSAAGGPPLVDGARADARVAAANQFISFAIGDDQYGVDIMAVREIKGWTQITHLPRQPDYMRGVLNLRGVMVPIIDLRCRFGQGMTEATPLHIVIVVQIDTRHVGMLADRVLDIVAVNAGAGSAGPARRGGLAC
jgi:purine-binding chemotaxis protein CheW